MRRDLRLSDWSLAEAATDVNECVDQFMVIWNDVMNLHCPPRRVRVRGLYCRTSTSTACEWNKAFRKNVSAEVSNITLRRDSHSKQRPVVRGATVGQDTWAAI